MISFFNSPIGLIQIKGTDTHITHIQFIDKSSDKDSINWPLAENVKKQLSEYFAGKRSEFDLPLQPQGTAFQLKVWQALQQITYGKTCTYGEIATKIGKPKAARAIGQANNRNPISIVIPCHRVIGANNKLTGYAGGLDKKEFLLALEKSV